MDASPALTALSALSAGVLAGLALAIPLGAIGVLLVQEGVRFGAVRALPAAAGVALVDVIYCALAIVVGSIAAPAVEALAPWPVIIGGVALAIIAAVGLRTGMGSSMPAAEVATSDPANRGSGMWRRFALFFGLTMINPATLVYFAAITAGLAQVSATFATAALFVTGVGAASFAWQALLTTAGGFLRGRTGQRTQRITVIVGNSLVALFGIVLIARGVSQF